MKNPEQLIQLFNRLFEKTEHTILIGGAAEPLYLPSAEINRLYFREDYFASALHEIAHWCLAGKKRRQLEDYGYWYKPDGRDETWQSRFEEVEVKPQALECIFSQALNFPFQVSVDNLLNPGADHEPFKQKVENQVLVFREKGLPKRAGIFLQNLG